MCGISGIINKNSKNVKPNEIKNINALISHRGPDDEGFYYEKNFAFAHRRLSILDLGAKGHQPMHYLDKYVITYNGEIYNYIEIKKELLEDGYVFHSDTDTEVILASYAKWGENCVNKFNGMWAFSIHDKVKNIIFSSRDRFGIKPFYYTEIDNKFIFGSEIKQLLFFYKDRYVNKKALLDYLVFNFEEYSNETFFENIFKLEQSHNLIYDIKKNSYEIKRYYSIEVDKKLKNIDEDAAIKRYKNALEEAIKLRLRSDVKVGTCLSGGLDSSSIATIASNLYQKESDLKFTAIHAKSIDEETDESSFAKLVATHCNLDLKIIEPQNKDFLNSIDEVIYTQEEPFGGPSAFMQYFVMKKAKEESCKVMLDGQGGDETLLGYNRYYILYLKKIRFINIFKELKNIKDKSSQTFSKILFYYIAMRFSSLRLLIHKRKSSFIKQRYLKYLSINLIKDISNASKNDQELQKLELSKMNLPMLLKCEDKNSMRHSIETRLPFIDFNLVQETVSFDVKLKLKYGWSKYILRKSIDTLLPKEIVWRKNKFGFEAPSDLWINKYDLELSKVVQKSLIIAEITDNLHWDDLSNRDKWKIFNIAKWETLYDVKIRNIK